MKAFVVFPSLCLFIITFALAKKDIRSILLTSLLPSATFGVFAVVYGLKLFQLFYYLNFILVPITIPFVVYLFNRSATRPSAVRWIVTSITACILVIALFSACFFTAMAYNPMDPAPDRSVKH